MSLCVDDRLVCRSEFRPAYQKVFYTEWHKRCRIDTINSPDDGHRGCPKHVENRNKFIRKNCESVWFIYKDCLSCFHLSLTQRNLEIGRLVKQHCCGLFSSGTRGILFETLFIVLIFCVCPLTNKNTHTRWKIGRVWLRMSSVCCLCMPSVQVQRSVTG